MSLVLRNMRAFSGSSMILRGIDLEVPCGEIVAVTGRNGAGKSTLLRAIAGLAPASVDELTLGGESLAEETPERRFAIGVTFVPQGHRVFGSLTVGQNVELGVRVRGESPWTLAEVKNRIPILAQRYDQRAGTLSGGETQLVLVARALVGNGRVVLMDEPAEGLDPDALVLVQGLLRECAARGAALVIAEAKTSYLVAIGARCLVLADGCVAGPSTDPFASDVFANP